jgi:flagellar protein FliS
MWNSAHDAYVESRVLSADPMELVRLLYQAAIQAVGDARRFLAEGKIAERSRAISKAISILIELNAALDHNRGGEISSRLAALYDYMLRSLLEANMHQSDPPLAEVFGLLSTLAEAWEATRTSTQPTPAVHETPWSLPPDTVPVADHAWSF